jgi:hypothetical protein
MTGPRTPVVAHRLRRIAEALRPGGAPAGFPRRAAARRGAAKGVRCC